MYQAIEIAILLVIHFNKNEGGRRKSKGVERVRLLVQYGQDTKKAQPKIQQKTHTQNNRNPFIVIIGNSDLQHGRNEVITGP